MLSCDLQHSRQLACWKVSRLMGSEQWKMHFQCWALMLGHARVSVHLLQVPAGTGGAAPPGRASLNATADGALVCAVSLVNMLEGRWLSGCLASPGRE